MLDDNQGAAVGLIGQPDGLEIVSFKDPLKTASQLTAKVRSFDAIVCTRERTPIGANVIQELPRLRLIVTTGIRNTDIDMKTVEVAGITVIGTKGQEFCYSTVELAWSLISCLVRRVVQNHNLTVVGGWQSGVPTLLRGMSLGLLGLGRAGSTTVPEARTLSVAPK